MRLALQFARMDDNRKFLAQGRLPTKLEGTVEEVFNLGTINGARAVNFEDQIGSLAEGKSLIL